MGTLPFLMLKPYMRYAQRINKAKGWKGHLWQGRFFSSPLDEAYTWSAIRYVERNPVRAGMVKKAEDYPWSSAAAHCGLINDPLLTPLLEIKSAIPVNEWSGWLALPQDDESIDTLRRNVEKGLPCGSNAFIEKLERLAERTLRFRPQGRPSSQKG
jgi:putative transposase